jgi:hypothetical protein
MEGSISIMRVKNRLLVILLVLGLASLACNLSLGAPETPAPPIPVTTEAVEELEEELQDAYGQAQQGEPVTLTIDEAQLTSLVAFELEKREEESVKNPQVYLRDGQVQVFGTVDYQGVEADASIFLNVNVDAQGKPDFAVSSAYFGPFPIPDDLVAEIEANLDQAFSEQINSMSPNLRIESIEIADGAMTITGITN